MKISFHFCIFILVAFQGIQKGQAQENPEYVIFEMINILEPIIDKQLHIEADFLKILEKLHIYTPKEICNKCTEHYTAKQKKYNPENIHETELMTILEKELVKICDSKKLYEKVDDKECQGIVYKYAPLFIVNYIHHFFDPLYQCGSQGFCENYEELSFTKYKEEILKDKPPKIEVIPTKKEGTYKVAQISDTHVAMDYTEGYEAECEQSTCCKESDGPGVKSKAGKWGPNSGDCDLPYGTVEEGIKYIGNILKPDILIWTGDSFGHAIWEQNTRTELNPLETITGYIKQYILNNPSCNSDIYPLWGNHENYPVDQYDFTGEKTNFLKNFAADQWKEFLPQTSVEKLRDKGFYSVKNEKYNIKIISMDTDVFNTRNYYLMSYPTNPEKELDWIYNELLEAETTNYQVIIIGHLPPSNYKVTQSTWTKRYNVLLERFENIIKGQFFGHTHKDELQIQKDQEGNPTNIAFVSPTFTKRFPSLRVMEFDKETNQLINIEVYRVDTRKANQENANTLENYWFKGYDFLEYYNFTKNYITVEETANFLETFRTNKENLVDYLYQSHLQRMSKQSILESIDADPKLQKLNYCEVTNGILDEFVKCMGEDITDPHLGINYEAYLQLETFSKIWYQEKKTLQHQN